MDATFGMKRYDVDETSAYMQLLFETDFTHHHNLSAGFSNNYDHLDTEGTENTYGAYAQYTYNLNDKLKQEEAWNYGASASLYIPIARKTLKLNMEYARTDFEQQAVIDYDSDTLHGLPTATVLEGMSLTTTEPAPMVTLSPMVTPGRMVTLPPIHTLSPMVTGSAHS